MIPKKETLRYIQMKDTLYNIHPDVANDDLHIKYGKGVLVGSLGTIMSFEDLDFDKAVKVIAEFLPDRVVAECIPESWMKEFMYVAGDKIHKHVK